MNNPSENLTRRYDGITRYAGVPTEQETGRLHYNENLYGPSPRCMDTLRETSFNDLCLYESGSHDDLTDALSEKFGVPVECIFTGNGSAENLRSIMNIFTKPGDTVLLPDPGWSYYTGLADCRFLRVERFPIVETEEACVFDENDLRARLEARPDHHREPRHAHGQQYGRRDVRIPRAGFPRDAVRGGRGVFRLQKIYAGRAADDRDIR